MDDHLKQLYREYRREPIRENLILFESLWGRSYSCNPAALYEYIIADHPEYDCVWSLNDVDTPVKGSAAKVERKSEEYFHYLATAKYIISNANLPASFIKRDGQIIVQTMHGTPFKTFGLDVSDELPTDKEKIRVVSRSMIWDYLVAQGEFTVNMAWRWFRYDNTVLRTGYPRTDALYHDAGNRGALAAGLREKMGLPDGKKVVLYAPTWRDLDRFDMMLDTEYLRREIGDEYILLVRPHYFVADKYSVPQNDDFVFDGGSVNKIEELFPITDILITDYSSVMFDFALTGKPMIFYAYDLEEYTKDTRGSYFDISEEAPGALAFTTGEVADAIKNADLHYESYGDRIDSFLRKYLTYEGPDSSAAIFDAVFVKDARDRRVRARAAVMSAVRKVIPGRVYKRARRRMILRRLADERQLRQTGEKL